MVRAQLVWSRRRGGVMRAVTVLGGLVLGGLGTLGLGLGVSGCQPLPAPAWPRGELAPAELAPTAPPASSPRGAPHLVGRLEDRRIDFQYEGGQLEFELYRDGGQIEQVVRNRYAVPVVLHWTLGALDNLEPMSPVEGVIVLPAAPAPLGNGQRIVLAALQQIDPTYSYRRELHFHARLGDPAARPADYVYGLPYPHGLTFAVLQGFHGAFSHHGSNEYAVDFACPIATPVLAARPGMVVATNAIAQGSGTTPDFLEDRRANFVVIRHSDGTLGEYLHLSPSGVEVHPGQIVERGQEIALSGNTGFSSTPHLHFQVITASEDGIAKHPFPFKLAVRPGKIAAPVQGQRYAAWE
ncbi:MAG TPA: M23 family metallopeptidase [Kofleriaceae bacterium]|nr:M23 family metallopeptidase [Kofleriaceae bacterium]